jgi:NitT/TauT family transport system substrate-binding protein
MANLTHAPALAGDISGRLARALAPLRLETRVVAAGPRVVEAMLGGDVDIGVAGPAAAVSALALHGPVLTVVAGMCSGGASFVLRDGERVEALAGRTLATPQLGSTQDVSLRKLLRQRGYATTDRGGDVRVTQMSGALAKIELTRGTLAGAWLPEPWASRAIAEAPAHRVLDERELWPDGVFASSIIVARTAFRRARPADVARFASAIATEVGRVNPDEAREALARTTRAAWSRATWDEAWRRLTYTSDRMRGPIEVFARDAADLGLLRARCDVATLFA